MQLLEPTLGLSQRASNDLQVLHTMQGTSSVIAVTANNVTEWLMYLSATQSQAQAFQYQYWPC